MNFKDYIVKNYEKEFSKPAPTSLVQTLFSISANHFSINAFAAHFNLDTSLGELKVQGVNLEMNQLDSINKTIHIKGEIESISYKKI